MTEYCRKDFEKAIGYDDIAYNKTEDDKNHLTGKERTI
jgi:hypothetical protein